MIKICWKNDKIAYFCIGKMTKIMCFLCWENDIFMLKRKIFKQIEHFYKTSKGALLVTGARQIGKTYSVRKFAKSNFKSFADRGKVW